MADIDFSIPIQLPANRVWRTYTGGRLLDRMEGKVNPQDTHFPEDWIASSVRAVNKGREHLEKEGISFIINKENGEKIYFDDLLDKYGEQVLGEEYISRYGKSIDILVKILDPSIRLHVQVHPTIEFAQRVLNSNKGKAESYVVIGHRKEVEHPYIYMGFKKFIEKEEWGELILKQDIEKMLAHIHKVPVKEGDVFIVEGGVPHALGEGLMVIEVQEPTDYVVRCEFKRGDYELPESARYMGVGFKRSLDVFQYKTVSLDEVLTKWNMQPLLLRKENHSKEEILIGKHNTDKFKIHRIEVHDRIEEKNINQFQINIVISGRGSIISGDKEIGLQYGDKFFVPACANDFYYQNNSPQGENLVVIKCMSGCRNK